MSSMQEFMMAPSILSADFSRLGEEIRAVEKAGADIIHVDVMDGHFVPNITIGPLVVASVREITDLPLDVHLMIVDPDRFISDFKKVGADILTVHYEACKHLHRTVQAIKQEGMQAGVSLNPHTPVAVLEDIIKDLDLVLIMSVNPGFGGQSFIENTYKKIGQLKELIEKSGSNAIIEIDGGVNDKNAEKLIATGANALVAGSFVFRSQDPKQTIHDLKYLKY